MYKHINGLEEYTHQVLNKLVYILLALLIRKNIFNFVQIYQSSNLLISGQVLIISMHSIIVFLEKSKNEIFH